jgi:WD40 repeat protein
VKLSPQGRQVSIVRCGTNSGLWELDTRQRRFEIPFTNVTAQAFSEDGLWLAASTCGSARKAGPSVVHVWDTRSGKEEAQWPVGEFVEALAVSATNHLVLEITPQSGNEWNLTNGTLVRTMKWEQTPASRKRLAAAWNALALVAGRIDVLSFAQTYEPDVVCVTPGGGRWITAGTTPELKALVGQRGQSMISILDNDSGRPLSTIFTPKTRGGGSILVTSPDEHWIAFNGGGGIFVFDAATGEPWKRP